MTASSGPWGPGLPNERTTLAWSRTGLSVVAVGLLTARQLQSVLAGGVLMVAVVLIAGAMVARADRRHHRRTTNLWTGVTIGAHAEIAAATAIALTLAACAFFVAAT